MSDVSTDKNIRHFVEKITEIDSDDLRLEVQNVKNHSGEKKKKELLHRGCCQVKNRQSFFRPFSIFPKSPF